MTFFKNLFGRNDREVPVEQICEDKLVPEYLEVHKTFRHGFPHQPSCLAYDSVQQLLAIGSHQGEIIVFGKSGLERHFEQKDPMAVLQMIFIENRGLLVTRCSNNTLYQWNIRDKLPVVTHTLEVQGESPCLMSWRFGSDWIYVGTELSNVYVVNLRKFQVSEYNIRKEAVSDGSIPIGEVAAIAEQPHHKKKLLLAYMSGLCVLWNLEGRLIKRQFSMDAGSSVNMLMNAAWHSSGHKFAAAYTNGSVAIFNADDGKLERILTCRGNPDPAFQLQWFNVDMPESWLLFAGVYPGSRSCSSSRHVTIHSSHETRLLSFPDPIVSFLCLPSSPYAIATQEASCLAVLTQEEIVMLDLHSPNLAPFSLAHALDLNCSAVTSVQLCGNCPDEFVALLSVMQSKGMPTDLSTKAIKSEGVWYRQSRNVSDWESSYVRMRKLDKYHGQASGIFACDEHLAGKMPSRGSELCTVVEAMYSWEVLFAIQGDLVFAERAEQLAYNALPATLTSDMWAHQYLQQDNEMNAVVSPDHVWKFDGPDSTTYGLAPNYGCCTANFNQGWPKFLQHMVMMSPDGRTVTVAAYGPLAVSTKEIQMSIDTDYPFADTVQVTAACDSSKTLLFRIPSWTKGATIQTNSGTPSTASNGTFKAVQCQGNVSVKLTFPMSIRVDRRYNNAASVYHGPLLYGLEIKEVFKILRSYEFESKDYEVTPGSPWNYAILLRDDNHPEDDLHFESAGMQLNLPPFSIQGAPSKITATGHVLDSWGLSHNAASPPPTSPVESSNPDQQVVLLPFGATDLRIAEIPTFITKE